MRIGVFDPYLDDLGGGEKYMMTAASLLSEKHDVTVFWDNKKDIDLLTERFSLKLDKVKIEKNIFSSKVNLFERVYVSKKYDALIVLIDGSIPFVLSKKLFLHIQQPLAPANTSSWKHKLKLSRINKVFYNSKFTKSFNDKLFPRVKSTVIYPPVSFLYKKSVKENIILHVGRFRVININNDDYKKQQIMVDVFKKMVDEGLNNWKFVLAASVNDEKDPKFKEMLGSASKYPVEFLINKNNKELWNYYNKAAIYWHASGYGENLKTHPEYAEHFGISTVEAMGAGAVPVVINEGGQREIVVDNVNGFLWNNLDELSKKTKQLMNDNNLLKKLSNSAIQRASDFSTEKFAKALEDLLV